MQKIVEQKRREIIERKSAIPLKQLLASSTMSRVPISMQKSLINGSGVIAEFKRASPSKGVINATAEPQNVAKAYHQAGVSGISVLTDHEFFQGSEDDLKMAKSVVDIPVLRKDFTVDPYQIYESKYIGADCILLIASILSKETLQELEERAYDIGLDVLVEIHEESELDKLSGRERIIGINNRNLDTFEVDIENSIRLAAQLPDITTVAESGLNSGSNLDKLIDSGFDGFLVGESFMKEDDPGSACAKFVAQISRR